MKKEAKQIIASVLSLLLLGIAYYGSYLPLRKAQAFVAMLASKNQFASFEELKETFLRPLELPSPIGEEELIRNTANSIMRFVQGNGDPSVIGPLVAFAEELYRPIMERGRGMSFGQNLYLLGAMNEIALVKTQDPKYLAAAKKYFSLGLELGPKRPQSLYGMFDIYRFEGNVDGVKTIAEQILTQWPNDEKTKNALAEFLQKALTGSK